MNLTSKYRLEQIRRRWWVVAVVTLLGVLSAMALSSQAGTTYVGKSTLMLSARTPEQDAVLATGYLTLFNDPATLERLKTANKIPADVAIETRTAGASPILTVEATASDPFVAQDAAEKMANAFSGDISSTPQAGRDEHLADMKRRLSDVSPFTPDGGANPYYIALLTQIDDLESNSVNQLLGLQPRAGVSENAPRTVFNLASGAIGGFLLGILAALGLAALSTRLASSADLRHRTGVEPLVEVPAAGNIKRHRIRRERLRTLGNIVSLEGPPKPSIIAVTDARGGRKAREVAEALAELSALRGSRTVLVYADNDPSPPADGTGFNDALARVGLVHHLLTDGDVESLRILPAGSIVGDRYSLMTRERIVSILGELRTVADTIVVATPPIADATETPLLCAAADITILVVTRKSARAADVTSAAVGLTKAHARLLGAVLIDGSNGKRSSPRSGHSQIFDLPSDPMTERPVERRVERAPETPAGARSADALA